MNLQYPKLIMRNDSIGIETLPTPHYFCTQALLLFATILYTHNVCLQCFGCFECFRCFRCFKCFATLKYPNQVRSMANLQFAVLCGSRVKGFVFVSFFVHRIVRFFRYCLPKPLFFRKFAKYLHIVY